MTEHVFKSMQELIIQAINDGACEEGLEYAYSQTFETIFKKIPKEYRVWCLSHGYTQFVEHCRWDEFTGFNFACLLSRQPQFAEHCRLDKINKHDLSFLIHHQPQFAIHKSTKD